MPALRAHLDRCPEVIHAIDAADDFQEVSLLCHAVCGSSIDAVRLLIERGAQVQQHSGKVLTLAAVMDRVDLVQLLIEQGCKRSSAASGKRRPRCSQGQTVRVCLAGGQQLFNRRYKHIAANDVINQPPDHRAFVRY